MKIWVLTIFRLAPKANRLVKSIDERMEKIALDAFGVTSEQYERIINLNDEKIKIINLAILCKTCRDSIIERDYIAIMRYARGESANEIALDSGVSGGAIRKRICRALERCCKSLEQAGFSKSKLDSEYAKIDCVARAKGVIERKLRVKENKNAYKKL